MSATPFKDIMEILDHTVTMFGIVGGFLGWYYIRRKNKEAGLKAVEQVNKIATNDIPHLYDEAVKTNKHLEEQTPLLQSIDKGIAVLVDRGRQQ